MAEFKRFKSNEFFNSLNLASIFFGKRTKYALAYALIVPGMFILRAAIDLFELSFRNCLVSRALLNTGDSLDGSVVIPRFSIAPGEMIMFMTFKIWWWGIEFVTKMAFECLVTPIGGILVQHMVHSMLTSEQACVFDVSPPSCEYVMTEGSKHLAKIIRMIFIGFIGHFIGILKDFYFIYTHATPDNKSITFVIMACYILVASLKLLHLNQIFYYTYQTTQINSKKEKLYVEAVDFASIVKSSREESKMVTRYQKALNAWEASMTQMKLYEYSNAFIFTMGFDTVTTFAMIFYINNLVRSDASEKRLGEVTGLVNTYHSVIFKIPGILNKSMKFYKDIGESIVLSQDLLQYMIFMREEITKKKSIESFTESIEVKDLVFSAKDKLIFSGVDFKINKGDKIALFGKNGSGKSSIFKLILGFDEFKGLISVDGISLDKLNMPEYRDLITYVPQDTKLFDESIFYNLTVGNNKTYKGVIEECKRMKIHEIIMAFPSGYNTSVGEGGKLLNGGLRQKIFYTRAFLCDTEIYMFDEPTNNLDSNHSKFLMEYINDRKYKEKTFFVICHDLEIVRKFPKIFHFEEGKVKEVKTI